MPLVKIDGNTHGAVHGGPTLPDKWPSSYRAMVKSLKKSGEIVDADLSHPQGPVFAYLQRVSKATMASIMVNAINFSHKKNMVQVPKVPPAPRVLSDT